MNNLPKHVAIIMDGNGRWARSKGLERIFGHSKGAQNVRNIVTTCHDLGIQVLTLYAFSQENWGRPKYEVTLLMKLLKKFLISERAMLMKKKVRLNSIGNTSRLPKDALKVLNDTKELTKDNSEMTLLLALSYGGREEMIRAFQAISTKVLNGELVPENITEEVVSAHLDTAGIPDPDLIIRTSGEYRTSNFLPWQGIYAEWYITPTLWPDFNEKEFEKALENYSARERRYGLVLEGAK